MQQASENGNQGNNNLTDKLDLSNKNFLDFIVNQRRILLIIITLITLFLAWFVPSLHTDPTLESGIDKSTEAYQEYRRFAKTFGNEEFVLVAMKNTTGATDPRMLEALAKITQSLESLDKIEEVVSLSNIKLFQQKGDLFGNYPVLQAGGNGPQLPEPSQFEAIKKALPITDLLISEDLKTIGILVRIQERWKFDLNAAKQIYQEIVRAIERNVPSGTEYRIIGPPFIRQAIVRYNVQTGIIFGILCMLIGTVVSVYVFRSVRVTAITNVILGICVLWILGLMALLKIPLNSTTVLSFGFIPITTVEIVIHMVVRYHFFHRETPDRDGAIKKAVRWLARPCLICTCTTAVGFGTLMVSSIPMVKQLGFIMSVGVLISYSLAMVLTPAFFVRMKAMETPENTTVLRGWLDGFLGKLETSIFSHYKVYVAIGLGITAFLLAGAPLIKSDTQILRMLSEKTKEVQDINFVEKNLTAVNSVELVLKSNHSDFKSSTVWEKVAELDKALKQLPEVSDTDSLLPLLEYLNDTLSDSGAKAGLFSNPAKVPQILSLITMSPGGTRITRRFINEDYDLQRISVRIWNLPDHPIGDTIDKIEALANSVMNPVATAVVTGDLAVVAKQTSELINDQIKSMFLAVAIITGLMIFQMNSVTLGLLCLIPNVPPLAAVFGIMGWFGVSLDAVTIFAASVAIGLAVDNTIHYLAQLKREIMMNQGDSVEDSVARSYRLTAKQISSWSTITMLGFLALVVSPFRPVVHFGILGCTSILLGLYGDLIFLQSLILASPRVKRVIKRLIEKEMAAQDNNSVQESRSKSR
ncbi:MAG: MMPL family transporter [Desulfomonile tiedjei]|uniref:MMPL family transporter n=1 Tax=Desulfomonile tiedjei TaxID=2358 RepID=A0A9D6UZ61_9BACT|nr:MMPL family transporter [Desulfomonile tiedjei]